MPATEVLKEEHRVIERMLNILKTVSQRLDRDEAVSSKTLKDTMDFIRTFADRCHHGKEEDVLYPAMEERGIPRKGGPIGVMLIEHDEGRKFVKGMVDAAEKYEKGEKNAGRVFAKNARGYVQLLTQHIFKEDNILYTMADSVLRKAEQKKLLESFQAVERERVGEGVHQRYLKVIDDLEKDLGWGGRT